jgi:hypothetical protein
MSDKFTKLSPNLLNAGIILLLFGAVGACCGVCGAITPFDNPAVNASCGLLGFGSLIVLALSALPIITYFSLFKLKPGHALIEHSDSEVKPENEWIFLRPNNEDIVLLGRRTESYPVHGFIELHTPDDGILGVKVAVTYCPDDTTGTSLYTFKQVANPRDQIQNRIKSSLNSWIRQKPLPGTLKRALAMQTEMENLISESFTSAPSEALVIREDSLIRRRQTGDPVKDLGILLFEIHITDMQPLERGTGKPDWGDGDQTTFNAQEIFRQFYASADNLSNLRLLKEALRELYPEEAADIDDIYDQVRISMKENRET